MAKTKKQVESLLDDLLKESDYLVPKDYDSFLGKFVIYRGKILPCSPVDRQKLKIRISIDFYRKNVSPVPNSYVGKPTHLLTLNKT